MTCSQQEDVESGHRPSLPPPETPLPPNRPPLPPPPSSFISMWQTSRANEAITLPLRDGYEYDFQVNWGDGSSSEVTSFDDLGKTHIYVNSDTYRINYFWHCVGMVFQ